MLQVDNINPLSQHPLIELQARCLRDEIFDNAVAFVCLDRQTN